MHIFSLPALTVFSALIPDPQPWLPLSVGMALTAMCFTGITVALVAGRSSRSSRPASERSPR